MKLEEMDDTTVLKVEEVMLIFRVSTTLAYKRIREVLSISNIYDLHGRITVYDYRVWLEYRKSRQVYVITKPQLPANTLPKCIEMH